MSSPEDRETPQAPRSVDLERGSFPTSWSAETDGRLPIVHAYNPDVLILRQPGRLHFEKPFLYLIFGSRRAVLVDTGAPGLELARSVLDLMERRAATGRLPLIVAHTHADSDHVANDGQFGGLPDVQVVGPEPASVAEFFGIQAWPDGQGSLDLGERVLDVVPVPGHEGASVAFYDRRTGLLLSGDVLYPGRLYIRDQAAFRASVRRLVSFTAERPVAHILGAHIENTRTPFVDYPEGTTHQPDEHALELGRGHLLELADVLDSMPGPVERRSLRDFTVWPTEG